MLTNDDDSSCRDFRGHTHTEPEIPAGTVITQGPYEWEGTNPLDCKGQHTDGYIETGDTFYVAESFIPVDERSISQTSLAIPSKD